jgi:sec-independent protein translocase protein TatC
MPMVNEPEEAQIELEEEDGGGPVKSFLEHLEDLRWTLIKCGSALFVGGIICLVAGNHIVELLKRPLEQSPFAQVQDVTGTMPVYLGADRIATVTLDTNRVAQLGFTNSHRLGIFLEFEEDGRLGYQLREDENADVKTSAVELLNLGPIEGFYIAIHLAIFGGLTVALPFILYYILQFVLPALKRIEKRFLLRGLMIGSVLFAGGVLFCYFVVLPIALNAAAKYSMWLGFGADQWRARDYISFVTKFMFGMGISFELPVLVLTMVRMGFVTYETLARIRPYMLLILLTLSAVLTPPDVISQIFMAIPLYVLYEVSVWIAWYWDRRDKRRLAALETAE